MQVTSTFSQPMLTGLRQGLFGAFLFLATLNVAHSNDKIGHSQCCGRQDVILIRGGAGYWPGAQNMADHLTSLGYVPTICQCWEYAVVADEIIDAVNEGRMCSGVIIVGYSSGADAACMMAARLGKAGVRVQTMVLMESTFGISVPANVDYCANYYGKRRWDAIPVFRGVAVSVKGSNTTLYNIDVKQYPGLADLAARNHFTISSTQSMRQIVGEILATRQPTTVGQSAPQIAELPTDLPSAK